MARKYIQALYETGSEYQDEIVQVPMEMYGLVSAAPVLRHIIRESGAVVYVTFYGIAQVHAFRSVGWGLILHPGLMGVGIASWGSELPYPALIQMSPFLLQCLPANCFSFFLLPLS